MRPECPAGTAPAVPNVRLLFALWPYVGGRPHPEAADPWGERHAADCLTGYHDDDLGPFLTVVATTDGETCRILYAGDATDALLAYAARVAEDTGHPPFEGTAIDQAREAFGVAVEEAAGEWAREAFMDWCEPDPDTSRSIRRMPESTRAGIASAARHEAHEREGEALDLRLCEALGIDPARAPAPLRLAA